MLLFVLSVLFPNLFMCENAIAGSMSSGAGSEHLWDNLHETNIATDEICVPYCHLLPDLTTDFMHVTPRHVVMFPFLLKGSWQSVFPMEAV